MGFFIKSDAGGNLLKILSDKKIFWGKIHRTINNPFHPVFFGIYGDVIYHHGAGFRNPLTRFDRVKSIANLYRFKPIEKVIDFILTFAKLKNRYRIQRILGITKRLIKSNSQISNTIQKMIVEKKGDFPKYLKGDSCT